LDYVPPAQYLKEGIRIMDNAFDLLNEIKEKEGSIGKRSPLQRINEFSGKKSKQHSPDSQENNENIQLQKLESKFFKLSKRLA
jgi:hypothetical protein